MAGGGLDVQRETWATVCNKALEEAGSEARITHQSHKALGIEQKPTFHIGKDAWHAHKRGIRTRIISRLKDILLHNATIERLRKFKDNLQLKPLYKIPTLDKAREALKQAFEQKPSLSIYPQAPEKER